MDNLINMKPISQEEVDKAGQVATELFAKYKVSEEDQNKLFNALAILGVWTIVEQDRKEKKE